MISKDFSNIAGRLMRQAAAPFHEHAVRDEVEEICAGHDLPFVQDRYGNVLVRLQTDRKVRPIVFAAHMDHPGFEIVKTLSATCWHARFLGGVPDSYFRAGLRVRLMPGAAPAILGRRVGREKVFEIRAPKPVQAPPRFAVWDLPAFAVRRGRIYARACDDLGGVAASLAAMISLKRSRARVNVIAVISRAEEIGFLGALTVAADQRLPKNALVISLETSRELPGVKMGDGVILRVGDRTSVFDSGAMRFLAEVAAGIQVRRKTFRWQRALMSGGTCESTAYQEFGLQTGAVCVALGNYHNCAPDDRIAAEFVDVNDAVGMTELLVEAARQMPHYPSLIAKLPRRLDRLLRGARKKLIATAEGDEA